MSRFFEAGFLLACVLATSSVAAQQTARERLENWLSGQGYGEGLQLQQVNIFGDGDPANGIEDSRIDMSSPGWNSQLRRPWNMSAGTIHCDGKNRGSAMIVDTGEFGRLNSGLIVATSAHVLFDLERKKLFSACQFHYMALDHLPGYQARISLQKSRLGAFDPASPRNSPVFGKGDWAFLYVSGSLPGVTGTGRLRLRSYRNALQPGNEMLSYQFIAYSPSVDSIAISAGCKVTESMHGDLGGGGWAGQLLDDCDSEGGASGGGLVATDGNDHYLVGIRSGAHWDGAQYPLGDYPGGPPDGAAWDVLKNTNFSRAIDDELIDALRSLVQEIGVKAETDVTF